MLMFTAPFYFCCLWKHKRTNLEFTHHVAFIWNQSLVKFVLARRKQTSLQHTAMISCKAMLCFIALALLLAAEPSASQVISPSCLGKCGNVSIPYPFGMEEGCYWNEDFKLNCDPNTKAPYLLGSDPLLQIQSISIDTHELVVYTPVANACYTKSGPDHTTLQTLTLSSPRFPFSSTSNKFTVVGCDTMAFLWKGDYFTGCFSICVNLTSVDDSSCSGAGCCQNSNLTTGLFTVNMTLGSILNHTYSLEFNPCDHAFLVDGTYTFDGALDLKDFRKTYVPTVVDWVIRDQNCSRPTTSPACKADHAACVHSKIVPGYYCQCSPGYVGNPYIPDGCEDICERRTCRSEIIKATSIIAPILLVALITGSFVLWIYVRRKQMRERRNKYFRQNGGRILEENPSLLEDAHSAFKIFTAKEMEAATNNFDEDRIVGRGGFGVVYKGYLSDGRTVAIKKSRSVDQYEIDQFVNEVVLLSKIQHQNVVGFHGCCLETPEPLLVYEFVTNETLFDHLYGEDKSSVQPWETRLKVAVETAGVLAYLHKDHRPPIIHIDIKPHNILLDDSYNAKVSDFGISKLAPQNETELYTKVRGTLGYLDPEFLRSSQLTDKSDVYSFGVVLLEMLTGQRVLSFDRPEGDRTLVKFFRSLVNEGGLVEILDEEIRTEDNVEEMKVVAKIAGRCVSVKADERPSMKEVAMELGRVWVKVKKRWVAHPLGVERRSDRWDGNAANDEDTSSSFVQSGGTDHILLVHLGGGR